MHKHLLIMTCVQGNYSNPGLSMDAVLIFKWLCISIARLHHEYWKEMLATSSDPWVSFRGHSVILAHLWKCTTIFRSQLISKESPQFHGSQRTTTLFPKTLCISIVSIHHHLFLVRDGLKLCPSYGQILIAHTDEDAQWYMHPEQCPLRGLEFHGFQWTRISIRYQL